MNKKRYWAKFYWEDWESDPALRLCSLAAQGLWMRMLCIAAKADPFGYVTVNGRPLDYKALARLTGETEETVEHLLSELDRNGVFSRDRKGRIYSRRMVRDFRKTQTARKNGKKGGNPTLCKNRRKSASDNHQDKPPDKPQDTKILDARIYTPSVLPDGSTSPPLESGRVSRQDQPSQNPERGSGYRQKTLNEIHGIGAQNPERGSENPERGSPEPIKNQSITGQEPIMREGARERTPATPLDEVGNRLGEPEGKTSALTEVQARPKKPTPRRMLEAVLRPEDAADVLEHRQRLRKPLTVRAAKALAREFGKLPAEQRADAVEVMLLKGWQGFRAEWFENWKISEGGASNGRARRRQSDPASASGGRPIDEIGGWLGQWLDEVGETEGGGGSGHHREGNGGQGALQDGERGGSPASGAASRLAVIPGGRRA